MFEALKMAEEETHNEKDNEALRVVLINLAVQLLSSLNYDISLTVCSSYSLRRSVSGLLLPCSSKGKITFSPLFSQTTKPAL